jgi:hypothetical protein
MVVGFSKVMDYPNMSEWVCGSKDRCPAGKKVDWLVI